ncbi:VCBS repeat-containing protein [Mucilaginibacter psychrotolerans]|nr:VCBS repeat-containing protein [Mucilaginibacter psychrotolerans]
MKPKPSLFPVLPLGLNYIAPLAMLLCLVACNSGTDSGSVSRAPLFKTLDSAQTHVNFINQLTEGLNTNVLVYEYFYNGGGAAVGDFNGDGLQDLYFTGNMVDNKLYLNKGHMVFADVTQQAGAAGRPGPWKTSATVADVNGDGRPDLYLCYSGKLRPEKRINQLLINQGNDAAGIPVFKDATAEYGLDFPSYSTQGYFFDYDRDGDLDLLLVNHSPERLNNMDVFALKELVKTKDAERGTRLLRNDDGKFKDVTGDAGIENGTISYGLAAGIADINGDGWPDIYLDNDYSIPDKLYINNGNGTFTNKLSQMLGHTSFFSMGNDVADINNDGHPDIFTLDMLPEDNRRQKLLMGTDNYEFFNMNVKAGFYYQYMRNMLHINNGNGTFSEVGQFAGISNTDWSWSPLFADYDNDGFKDLFVTNGFLRDYTNMDFLKYMGDNLKDRSVMRQDLLNLVKEMPSSHVKNYLFRNKDGLSFTDVSAEWGITEASNSNGSVYVDLDNDGDLDLVTNNVNEPASILENNAAAEANHHYLDIKLKGAGKNTDGIGALITLYAGGKQQTLQQMPARGYQSSVTPVLHFGLGKIKTVDSVRVTWQSGKTQVIAQQAVNKQITLSEQEAGDKTGHPSAVNKLFTKVESPINYSQPISQTNDFKRQPLLVNPISFSGPHIVKADVDKDGREDVFIGGGKGQASALYMQKPDGSFIKKEQAAFAQSSLKTEVIPAFFDANGDGYPDIYCVSGGYDDLQPDDKTLGDELYLNDKKGNFVRATNAIPALYTSKSCVKAADFNGDGAPDLFIGGRVIPDRYPETPNSYLLLNDGKGHFTDATQRYLPLLSKMGMVTDAAWVDMNGDKRPDLVVVGEWMPVTIFVNANGKFIDKTADYLPKQYSGWWNCITVGDFNKDGHPDLILGNQGINSQCKASDREPAELFFKDFDKNGAIDPILCFYIQHQSYPYLTRDELLDQISIMRGKYTDYKSYADATLQDIFTAEQLQGAGHLSANTLATTYFLSDKTGKLHPQALPAEAQFSPIFTITPFDYDHDGIADLLLCGNMNKARLRFGKYDANYGLVLKGLANGSFKTVNQAQSGFNITGDVRSVLQVADQLLFAINQSAMQAYKPTGK